MKTHLFHILLCIALILAGCSKKESIPSDSAPDIISSVKPIVFRNENISVGNLTRQPDGGFLASGGISYSDKSLTDGFVINLNSEGDTVWCRKIRIENFPNTDVMYALRNSNEEIIIAGVCSFISFKKQIFIGWLNGTGDLTKYVLFPMEDNQAITGMKIIPSENGNFYFATSGSNGEVSYALNIDLLDKDGSLMKSKTLNGIQTGPERLYPVENNNLLLVGSIEKDFPDYADFLFLLLDPSGNEKYRRSFGTTGYDVGYSACTDGNGGYIFTGMATNLSRPAVYIVNSSGIVSGRIVIDDQISSNATIILPAAGGGYIMIIQSFSKFYFKKLGNDLAEEKSWVISNPNPYVDLRTAFMENDGSVTFLYTTDRPVIVKTVPLN